MAAKKSKNEKPDADGRITITIDQGRGPEERSGRDLDDVVRSLVSDWMTEAGWSHADAAKHFGVARSTLNDFLKGRPGKLRTLSAICIALKMTPDRFFQDFEDFRPETRKAVLYAEDRVYDRFRTAMTVDEARELLDVIDDARKQGDLSEWIDGIKKVSGHQSGKAHGRKRKKTKAS